ncbi:MAG: hypothetical protein U7126_21870 [Microcoleus sp.]
MTQILPKPIARQGRVFPDHQLDPVEKARRQAENEAFGQRCRAIFERVAGEIIPQHYDWYIVIEPDSGDYAIDPDDKIASQKIHTKHPHAKCLITRLNETGCCGKI